MSDNPMDIFLKMHALEKKRNELLERCDKLQAENERLQRQVSELHGEMQLMREEHQQDLEMQKERSGQ